MAFTKAEHQWNPISTEWSPHAALPDMLEHWHALPAWDNSQLPPQSLQHAHTSNDWDNELVKIMHQTSAALQQQQPARILVPALDGAESSDYPATPHPVIGGGPPVPTSQLGGPCLHRLESLDPLLFPHQLRETDAEMLETALLHWDTAGAAATVSIPQAGLQIKGHALNGIASMPSDKPPINGVLDESKPHVQALKKTATLPFTSLAFPAPPDSFKVEDLGSLSPIGLPHSDAILAHPSDNLDHSWVPSSCAGGGPSGLSVPLQKWESNGGAQVPLANSSLCLFSHDEPVPRGIAVSKPRRACTQRQSNRVHRAPKWQDMYASVEEGRPPSPSPPRTKSSPKKPQSPAAAPKRAGRKRLRVDHITLDTLQEQGLFDVPIQTAALELGVGLSVLKRICRQIGLARWPFRTRQSLRGVIAKTQQYLGSEDGEGKQKADVVQALQQTLDSLQGEAGQGLSDSVRKYRQSVFKLNYKIKKNAQRPRVTRSASPPAIPATAAAKMAASALPTNMTQRREHPLPTRASSRSREAFADQDCDLLDMTLPGVHFEQPWDSLAAGQGGSATSRSSCTGSLVSG